MTNAEITLLEEEQLDFELDNTPGTLAKVCDALEGEGVNILGMSCTEGADKTTCHFVFDDLDKAKDILEPLGSWKSRRLLSFLCPADMPGILSVLTKKCHDAGVNIGSVYASSAGTGHPLKLFMWVDEDHLEQAKEALQSL